MAFALISEARHSLHPAHTGRTSNDAAGIASCYGPHSCSPIRAFDAGLQPDPFPDQAASLLPGLLAATRTGLTPASDHELSTTDHLHQVTSRELGARKIEASIPIGLSPKRLPPRIRENSRQPCWDRLTGDPPSGITDRRNFPHIFRNDQSLAWRP